MAFEREKRRAIEMAMREVNKRFGDNAVMRLDQKPSEVEVIPTGCLAVDVALGVGGMPRGRIVEIYGVEGGGKSTLALHVVANAQKARGAAAYIDAEHAIDVEYAKEIGVIPDELCLSQPSCGEEALEITEALIRSGEIDVVVVDSVSALVPRAELDGEMGDVLPGAQARLMSQALRKLTAVVGQSNTCLIFINQLRNKIGVIYGSGETTSGGRALKFYASVRLDVRRVGALKDGEEIIGAQTKVQVVKNKVAPPFKTAMFDLIYGKGISGSASLLDLATDNGIVERSGAWYSYRGERLGQGRERAKESLDANEELQRQLYQAILDALAIKRIEKTAIKSGTVS